jgi:hypothetical protein
MRQRTIFTLAVTAVVVAVACSGGSPSGPSPSGGTGTLNLRLTDSPFTDARAVLVTFSTVTAHRSESDWTAVPFAAAATSRTCDLKRLEGPQSLLGTGPLPAGRYTMVRLVVSSAAIYFDNATTGPDACAPTLAPPAGRSASLEIPSGEVKLNRGFDLTADGATTILLDFDGDRSIRETGNGRFMMSPVIGIVSVQ